MQESKEMVVLGAIKNGNKTFGKIRKAANVDSKSLDVILKSLDERGLINVRKKKGWLGTKVEISLTENGEREIEEQIRQMEQKWSRMVYAYKSGNKKKLNQMMDDHRSILPMMIFFGIIDMMMFSMMFSMMGASMGDYVPADQMPADADMGDAGGADDAGGMDGAGDAGGFDFDIGF